MEPERRTHPGMGDKPHEATSTVPQGAALGETVKVGLDRAGALAKDASDRTRGSRDGGVGQIEEDVVEYVRRQPMAALLIATGVGILVGMLLVLGRKAEGR